jgi:hypothetical protein
MIVIFLPEVQLAAEYGEGHLKKLNRKRYHEAICDQFVAK